MITKYDSREFKELRNILYDILENYVTNSGVNEEKRELAIFFYEILEKDNIGILFELDKLKDSSISLGNSKFIVSPGE